MKFNNRPNKSYKVDGKEIWESRSPALVGVVIALHKNRKYVLIGQRGRDLQIIRDFGMCHVGI